MLPLIHKRSGVYLMLLQPPANPSMKTLTLAITSFLALGTAALPAGAQKTVQTGVGHGGSPHVTSEWTLGNAHISISYGRPYLKGRSEDKMMPPGKPWRSGADEATVITTDAPLTFGNVKLAPGSYTINTEPGASSWQIIFGKLAQHGQWGVPYRPELEMGRTQMKVNRITAPVEQVTYSIDPSPGAHSGTLRIEWGSTSTSVPFTVGS